MASFYRQLSKLACRLKTCSYRTYMTSGLRPAYGTN